MKKTESGLHKMCAKKCKVIPHLPGTLGPKAKGAPQAAPQVQNGQEDRPASVPRPVHEGEG